MNQRSTKFRVWDSHCKYFINFDMKKPMFDDNQDIISFQCDKVMGDHDAGDRFTFLQGIGLTDKNGKEIFEGDIVRQIYGEIFYLRVAEMFNLRRELENSGGQIEVVGNIYEDQNPEPELPK